MNCSLPLQSAYIFKYIFHYILSHIRLFGFIFTFCILIVSPEAFSNTESHFWDNSLKEKYYPQKGILEDNTIFYLEVPPRAEDPAVTPVKLISKIPQSKTYYIKTISFFIDNNPEPFVARFHLNPENGRADLTFRTRVNTYSYIRAIAETNDGVLRMQKVFVKASGGCSAPIPPTASSKKFGEMKVRLTDTKDIKKNHLMIIHPNITGLQLDQVSQGYPPEHFINHIEVTSGEREIIRIESDISISRNPSFSFYFKQNETDHISILARDNKENVFSKTVQIE